MGTVDASYKVSHFKCFGPEPQGFERIKPFNIIVGRNNSGKSSLLDMIQQAMSGLSGINSTMLTGNSAPSFVCRTKIPEAVVKSVFPEQRSGGIIPGPNHWEFGKRLIGTEIEWQFHDPKRCISLGDFSDGTRPLDDISVKETFERELANAMPHPLSGRMFCRITAERNIVPEVHTLGMSPQGDGTGVTSLMQEILNLASQPSELVEIRTVRL